MAVINGWRRGGRARVRAANFAAVAVLLVLSVVAASIEPHQRLFSLRWSAVVLATVGCGALLWRRRHPVGVLVVTVCCGALFQSLGFRDSPLVVSPVLVSVYNMAVRTDRRSAWLSAAAAAAVLVGTDTMFASSAWLEPDKVAMLAWTALPAAIGDGVRSRRAYVAAVEERAEHAERTREQEARQRVAAERVRIARELHDIVTHHIALINARAGVAVHLVEQRPEQILRALEDIRDTSRSVLDELRVTVGLLRQSGDPVAPRGPMPGLAEVPALLASFERAGLAVSQVRSGTAEPLEPAVDLVAYRIVQESLTNVHKHAGAGRARLFLHYHRERLTIAIEDDGAAGPTQVYAGPGHGLIGMRERAATVGGRLYAGPRPEGGFSVTAELPLRAGQARDRGEDHDDSRTACR
ncbi:sensor histidine kinase [Streptomyces sp. Tue6028]|uniref:sensor histidine kinase n=1 Tax=Streptomyces sp. Tue6028 TaxID=2036037 RepID=UPI003EBFCE31